MRGNVCRDLDVTATDAPLERHSEVRQLGLHPVDLAAPRGTVPLLPPRGRLGGEVRRVPVSGRVPLIGLRQPLVGEGADRLEQAVPGAGRTVVGSHQGLAHQGVEELKDLDVVARLRDVAQSSQVEPAGEDRRRAQGRALAVVQQVVGPRHRAPQGGLAIGRGLGPGEQPESGTQPVPDLDRAHRRHPRGSKLDAEGDTVHRLADLDHGARGLLVEDPESLPDSPGPLREQRHGVGGHAAVHRQWGHGEGRLPGDAEVLSRRRQDPRDGGAGDDLPDRRRGRHEDVLAVVQQDEQLASGHRLGDRLDDAGVALRGDAEGGGDRVGDRFGVGHRCQLDEPDAVSELVGQFCGDREGEAGLADAAHAAEGDERTGADQRRQLGQHLRAPDESGGRARQVAVPSPPGSPGQSGTDASCGAASGLCRGPSGFARWARRISLTWPSRSERARWTTWCCWRKPRTSSTE